MTRKDYFALVKSEDCQDKYIIIPIFENLPKMSTLGNFALLPARVMNLSYAQYLRFCRDIVGAEIRGKREVYPTAYFDRNINATAFVRLLNSRMNLIMWEREHPDWREHQAYLERKNKRKGARNNVSDNK